MIGKRVFRVRVPPARAHAAAEMDDPVYETYDTTMVGFEWHFVPRMYVQMESKAPFVVRCRESGLRAEVRHKPRKFAEGASGGFRVIGRVFREADPERTLFAIAGRYEPHLPMSVRARLRHLRHANLECAVALKAIVALLLLGFFEVPAWCERDGAPA